MRRTSFILLLLALAACHPSVPDNKRISPQINQPVVFIQPLGHFNDSLLNQLKIGIETVVPAKLQITSSTALPANAWYAPRHRYWADTILFFLQPMHIKPNEYTLGVTEEDISTKNGTQPNWGVMGLGLQPGHCCVVSTYRLYRYPQTQQQLFDKLLKVSLHELGHNFGLPHCSNTHCIMTDAKGKDNLVNENDFCSECRKMLAGKGLQLKPMVKF